MLINLDECFCDKNLHLSLKKKIKMIGRVVSENISIKGVVSYFVIIFFPLTLQERSFTSKIQIIQFVPIKLKLKYNIIFLYNIQYCIYLIICPYTVITNYNILSSTKS